MEDEGQEDLRGVLERGPEMPVAGGVFMNQGLPLVQCLEGQVRHGRGGIVGGRAFKEEEGGSG